MIVSPTGSIDPDFVAMLELARRLFPRDLLESEDELGAEADGRSRLPYRYLLWKEEVVTGFVRYVRLAMDVGFVVHIGVDPGRQGCGIGRRLIEAARQALVSDVVVAEVEDGHSLDWWRRQGAEIVSSRYTQPPLHADTRPMALNLVALGPWRTVPNLVERFYAEVWELGADHSFVRRAVAR